MTQQDYTAPEYPVRVSRKERYQDVFSLFLQDGETPDTSLAQATFLADLFDASGRMLTQAACSQLSASSVQVTLNTAQMSQLTAGRYRLEVYCRLLGERDDLVTILLEVR